MESITTEPPQYDVLFKDQDFPGSLPTPNDIESGEPLPIDRTFCDKLVRIRNDFIMKYGPEISIAKTLRDSLQQLRRLQHPGYFGNIDGGPPLDDVFTGTQGGLKNVTSPFATEEELINSVIRIFSLETRSWSVNLVKYYQHVLPTVLHSNKAPVFTHNDLQRKNIMVQDDGTIVIIDWEYSSWYPVYWEYSTAMFANGGWRDDWGEYLRIILDEYPNEAVWICQMKTQMWS
ncbi:unnamed protein product [Fusarium graminearum]|nr:unnamed protein product [Fusarium graminearum]